LNKKEREWIRKILQYGCVACRKDGRGYEPAVIHHLIKGGKRMGHLYTIPLCPAHHVGEPLGKISRHKSHKLFNLVYGGEMKLYEELKKLLLEQQ
jgi:hypothetical protein